MSHDAQTAVKGVVTDIFGHRFVVKTARGKILADLTPHGADRISLKEGDEVELSGEMKPTELKIHRISKDGGETVVIDHKKPHEHGHAPKHEHEYADPKPALKAAKDKGFAVVGVPRRKPKHFEVLGRDKAGAYAELHVELDGHVRKIKPVDSGDHKWSEAIARGG
ncbi:MAG TPA: hypothetical protein VG271_15535 [Beijerinckiaceae bacterium]|jgi:hypothetical protein|nr:hypothetical protein [Beijerinckiaceae bacterium]